MTSPTRTREKLSSLEIIRKELMRFATDDRQALNALKEHWASLPYEEQKAIGRQLRTWGYKGTRFDALCEWAFERLHLTRSEPTCLRPARRAWAGSPTTRPASPEWWPGKSTGCISAGLPGLGRRQLGCPRGAASTAGIRRPWDLRCSLWLGLNANAGA